jgi:hypothetical protein
VLSNMVMKLLETPSVRLLKHIVRCYLRLSEHPRFLCRRVIATARMFSLFRLLQGSLSAGTMLA